MQAATFTDSKTSWRKSSRKALFQINRDQDYSCGDNAPIRSSTVGNTTSSGNDATTSKTMSNIHFLCNDSTCDDTPLTSVDSQTKRDGMSRRSKIPIKTTRTGNVLESSEDETSSKQDNMSFTCGKQHRSKRSKIPVFRKNTFSSGSDASEKDDASDDNAGSLPKSRDTEGSKGSTEIQSSNCNATCSVRLLDDVTADSCLAKMSDDEIHEDSKNGDSSSSNREPLKNEQQGKESILVEKEKSNELRKVIHDEVDKTANEKAEHLQIQNKLSVQQLEKKLASLEHQLTRSRDNERQKNDVIKTMDIQIKEMQISAEKTIQELEQIFSEKAKFEEEVFDAVSDLEETIELLTEENGLLAQKNKQQSKKIADLENKLKNDIRINSSQQSSEKKIQLLEQNLSERANFEGELIDAISDLEETIELLSEEKNLLTQKNEQLLQKLEDTERELENNKVNSQQSFESMIQMKELQVSFENTTYELEQKLSEKTLFEGQLIVAINDLEETIQLLTEENGLFAQKNEQQLNKIRDLQNELQNTKTYSQQPSENNVGEFEQKLSEKANSEEELIDATNDLEATIQLLSKEKSLLIQTNKRLLKKLSNFEFDEQLNNEMSTKDTIFCGFKAKRKLSAKDKVINSLKAQREELKEEMRRLEDENNKLKEKVIILQQDLQNVKDRSVKVTSGQTYTPDNGYIASLGKPTLDVAKNGSKENRTFATVV